MLHCLDGARKLSNKKRRTIYSRNLYHRNYLYKRRKLLDGSCFMNTDGVLSSESDYSSHGIGVNPCMSPPIFPLFFFGGS